jgi:Mg chelatase-like protein
MYDHYALDDNHFDADDFHTEIRHYLEPPLNDLLDIAPPKSDTYDDFTGTYPNLLMIGPPGSGKSMIAKRVPTILPPLTLAEAIETTKVHSVSGLLNGDRRFVTTRPFRSPHHTISNAGLLGGTGFPSPGEVSVAHNGVLFLDELPEFHRSTLEVMRQPLEDGCVTISRAAGSVTFPAEFMLVAAMNPCPCGHYGDLRRECRCTPVQVQKYRNRLSGPLLDRIDIHVEVPAMELKDLTVTSEEEPSMAIRQRVARARFVQLKRFASETKTTCNARMTPRMIRKYCSLFETIVAQAVNKLSRAPVPQIDEFYDGAPVYNFEAEPEYVFDANPNYDDVITYKS